MALLSYGETNGHRKALIRQELQLKRPLSMTGLHISSTFSNLPLLPTGPHLGAACLGHLLGVWAERSGGQEGQRGGQGISLMNLCAEQRPTGPAVWVVPRKILVVDGTREKSEGSTLFSATSTVERSVAEDSQV